MNKINKTSSYFLISSYIYIIILEIIFRINIGENFNTTGFIFALSFNIFIISFIFLISKLFKNNIISKIILYFSFSIISIFYIAQIVYYSIFRSFFTIYMMTHGLKAFAFWHDMLLFMAKNIFYLLAIVIITIISILIIKKSKEAIKFFHIFIGIFSSILIMIILIIFGGTKYATPSYALKTFNTTEATMESLGLPATFFLDIIESFTPLKRENKNIFSNNDKKEETLELKNIISTISETEDESTNKIKEYGYNITNINFESINQKTNDKQLQLINSYIENVPATKQNEMTGIFKNKNLIMICAESLSPLAISKELTPTLYKMKNEGLNFTNYYCPMWAGSTSDGEFSVLSSLIPQHSGLTFLETKNNYLPLTLSKQFEKENVKCKAYHDNDAFFYNRHETYPNLGYEYKGVGLGLELKNTWPESDLEMIQKTTKEYLIKNENGIIDPFHIYYMTVSAHLSYNFSNNAMAYKNYDYVKGLKLCEESKAYLACNIELDKAIEQLLYDLEEANELENTVIVLYPDHYPYALSDNSLTELAGHIQEKNFEKYKSNLIIYNKEVNGKTCNKYCYSIDILPSLLNMFGFEYDSRLLVGRDIFSNSESLVIFRNKSWISDKGLYYALENRFEPFDKEESLNNNYIEYMNNIVEQKMYISKYIVDNDYYKIIFDK
ncbi:MAG: LTA synthase family protein [Eubacteriales bacterium]|nr:LTA synthase family protein [Eubacteriales bacterium]